MLTIKRMYLELKCGSVSTFEYDSDTGEWECVNNDGENKLPPFVVNSIEDNLCMVTDDMAVLLKPRA